MKEGMNLKIKVVYLLNFEPVSHFQDLLLERHAIGVIPTPYFLKL
jgi:hypothetical protein